LLSQLTLGSDFFAVIHRAFEQALPVSFFKERSDDEKETGSRQVACLLV